MRRGHELQEPSLDRAALGQGVFKAVRGDYGTGETFFARWLEHREQRGFATADVQISETETPLHRMETIYRRALENLRTREVLEARYIAATVMDVSEAQQGAG